MPVKESKDSEVQRLKKRIRKLEKEKAKLLSEVNTLEAYFKKTQKYIEGYVGGMPVERLIEAAKHNRNLKTIKEDKVKPLCKKCLDGTVKENKGPYGIMIMCQNPKCNYVELQKDKTKKQQTEG
jgi:hypothetical protein